MLLSICIATLNRADFIGKTLEAFLTQNTQDVEIVVVDGASKDNTQQVVEEFARRFPCVRYFREETNSGVDKDYDKSVGYARGQYCWLFSDDDLPSAGAVELVQAEVEDSQLDLLVVNCEFRDVECKRLLRPSLLEVSEDKVYTENDLDGLLGDAGNPLAFIGSVVIRRDFWLSRDRTSYAGSMFGHVGVIFQLPKLKRAKVLTQVLVTIRCGNASWAPRSFEICYILWPRLIWSFEHISENSRRRVCQPRPMLNKKILLFNRAVGALESGILNKNVWADSGLTRTYVRLLTMLPVGLVNFFVTCYFLLVRSPISDFYLYDLLRCKSTYSLTRIVARLAGHHSD